MPFDSANYQPIISDPILRRMIEARECISRAWCQHSLRRGEAVCARGALLLGVGYWGNDPIASMADRLLAAAIPQDFKPFRRLYGEGNSVVDFNNDARTKQSDVLALFDRAIAARHAEQAKVTA